MYLNGKKYVYSYDEKNKDAREKLAKMFPETKDLPVKGITIEIGYWRKANHIHKWFVDKVQKGTDDCGNYEVTREQLGQLKFACQEVLKHKEDKVFGTDKSDLLPTASGFFFGGTDKDEYYYRDCQETINIIDKALELDGSWDFEYHSSW